MHLISNLLDISFIENLKYLFSKLIFLLITQLFFFKKKRNNSFTSFTDAELKEFGLSLSKLIALNSLKVNFGR